jgi:hypothetical protein
MRGSFTVVTDCHAVETAAEIAKGRQSTVEEVL